MATAKKCMIIGASPIEDNQVFLEFDPKDYCVICADGGYETAMKYGIVPDYIVGDFDSVQKMPSPENRRIKVLPVKKDVTDTMYAVLFAMKMDIREFVLLGCLNGPRYDHTMANYNVMLYIVRKGGKVLMADSQSKVFLLQNGRLRISQQKGAIISVFPFGTHSCNVSYKGLLYPLTEADLTVGDTLMGVSNEISEDLAEIVVRAGCALIIAYNH